MPKSVFTRRIASGRQSLEEAVCSNRKDSSDPAQTTAGEESGSLYSKGCRIYGELRVAGKKEKLGLAFGGVEGLPRVRAPADGFSAADPVFAPAAWCTRSDMRQLLGRGGQTGPNAEDSRPCLPLVRLSPATFDGCVRLFPLFFKIATEGPSYSLHYEILRKLDEARLNRDAAETDD